MKKRIFILALGLIGVSSCEKTCDCEFVTSQSNPSNDYTWTVTCRSEWKTTCEEEVLSSTYTASNGEKWYRRTEIKCR